MAHCYYSSLLWEQVESGSGDRSELVSEEERVEQDELNTHEVMATLTQLLTHMERNKINPIVEEVAMSTTYCNFNCCILSY